MNCGVIGIPFGDKLSLVSKFSQVAFFLHDNVKLQNMQNLILTLEDDSPNWMFK